MAPTGASPHLTWRSRCPQGTPCGRSRFGRLSSWQHSRAPRSQQARISAAGSAPLRGRRPRTSGCAAGPAATFLSEVAALRSALTWAVAASPDAQADAEASRESCSHPSENDSRLANRLRLALVKSESFSTGSLLRFDQRRQQQFLSSAPSARTSPGMRLTGHRPADSRLKPREDCAASRACAEVVRGGLRRMTR